MSGISCRLSAILAQNVIAYGISTCLTDHSYQRLTPNLIASPFQERDTSFLGYRPTIINHKMTVGVKPILSLIGRPQVRIGRRSPPLGALRKTGKLKCFETMFFQQF